MKLFRRLRLHFRLRSRPGMTLVELLLFAVIAGIIGVAMVPILFLAAENRLLQQTASLVEQNGIQVLQQIAFQLRQSEKILDPPLRETGAVLALQSGSGALDPTVIGISSGALVVIRHNVRQVLSSSQVAIEHFTVRNTSLSPTSQSVQLSFQVSRTLRLRAPRTYSKPFETVLSLFPVNTLRGNPCGCALPGCTVTNTYAWQICQNEQCLTATSPLDCGL